jgi:hypothetical protein
MWVRARLCSLQKKGCTRLAAASDKVHQLLAHGRWFSPGTPASSTTKTGRHDIAEILLKVALSATNQIKSKLFLYRRGCRYDSSMYVIYVLQYWFGGGQYDFNSTYHDVRFVPTVHSDSYMEYERLTFAGHLVLLPVINLALIFICVYTPVDFLAEVVFVRYISLNLDRSVFFL